MPFGLCNTPVMFQHLTQNTLGELNLTYCVIYLDDIIVFGRMEEEHLEHLRVVFERFWKFNSSSRKSSTWPITSHGGASSLVRRMCGLCRNSQCPRLICRSMHFVD